MSGPTAAEAQELKKQALDLRRGPPRSPHEKLGGYVIAARSLDKCRAFLLGQNGEYNFDPCGLSGFLWDFTGIKPETFKNYVATGANDDAVAAWLQRESRVKETRAVIRWNNEMRCKLIRDLPDEFQEFYEDYIPQFCPHPHRVRFFFDVYDAEEGRL